MDWLIGFIILIVKLGVVLVALLLVAAYLVLVERKFLARLQIRYGPNRAGKFGLLQPFADAVKMMLKEDLVPAAADRMIFLLAPAVVAFTALLMFAVVPFGNDLMIGSKKIPMVISDLNVGLLFVFAMS
ncbi:MAG: NADH-quinone oxidoreductase subunit H, partial [Desulfobacterales bacterium]